MALDPYQSTHTGEQIDEGIDKANTAVQPETLVAALEGKQDELISGTNIKTVAGKALPGSGNVELDKDDVGLSNVDNTSDMDKPVSTAQADAIIIGTDAAVSQAIQQSDLNTAIAIQEHVDQPNPHEQYAKYGRGLRAIAGGKPAGSVVAGNTVMSRKMVYLGDTGDLQINFGNWRTNNAVETAGDSNVEYFATWEYPLGTTPRKFLWGGNESCVVLPGDDSPMSDPMPNPDFVLGTCGCLAVYASFSGSNVLLSRGVLSAIGEGCRYGTGVANQTMVGSGTPLSGGSDGAGNFLGPLNIVSMTGNPAVWICGDSRKAGSSETSAGIRGGTGNSEPSLIECGIGFFNGSVGGTTGAQFTANNSVRRRRQLQYYTHVECGFGINDMVGDNATSAQLLTINRNISLLAGISGKPFALVTLDPYLNSGWSNGNLTSTQVVMTNNAQRVLYNDALRAGAGNWINFVSDYAQFSEHPYESGKWIIGPAVQAIGGETPTTLAISNYISGDGLHYNNRGRRLSLEDKVNFCFTL